MGRKKTRSDRRRSTLAALGALTLAASFTGETPVKKKRDEGAGCPNCGSSCWREGDKVSYCQKCSYFERASVVAKAS